jgi:transposase
MRGQDHQQSDIFSYLSPEQRVRQDHPLRAIRAMADLALSSMTERFDAMYAKTGRPSIPPEKLLRAQLIQMLYSVRSERLLMEEIDYSVLYRWFVGMNLDEPVWDVTVFTKNRDRLLDGDVAREFLSEVVRQAQEKDLTSDEHFTVDGTLIEAWASLKSFQRKDEKNEPLTIPAIRRWTSTERSAATKRTNPRPIRTRFWRARVAARKPS